MVSEDVCFNEENEEEEDPPIFSSKAQYASLIFTLAICTVQIIIGCMYLNSCPKEPMVPIFLIGMFYLIVTTKKVFVMKPA